MDFINQLPPSLREAIEQHGEEMEDAFIEKALEFFENDLCCYIKAQDFVIEHGRLEKDFKNYMKQ